MSDIPTPITDLEVEENKDSIPKYGWVDPVTARGIEQKLCSAQLRLDAMHLLFSLADGLSREQWIDIREKLQVWADEAKAK